MGNVFDKTRKVWQHSWIQIVGVLAVLAVLITVAVSIQRSPAHAVHRVSSGQWTTYLGDNGHSNYNGSETIITPATAPNLKQHWAVRSGGRITSQVTVANGMIFWGSWDGNEHASDPATGNDFWAVNLGVQTQDCQSQHHGVLSSATFAFQPINGVSTPVVYVAGGDVNLYALNANTGAVIWKTPLGSAQHYFLYASPTLYKGSLYIGVSGVGDCNFGQGEVVQVNALTGVVQHTFIDVPSGCTGASIWVAPTIDSATGILYVSTGEKGVCPTTEKMGVSIISLNTSDLSLSSAGYWQIPANNRVGDGDFGSTPTLFQATIGGIVHQMVGVENKNGVYYAFDRSKLSAGPLWSKQIATLPTPTISSSAWDGNTLYVAGATTTISGKSCYGSIRALSPVDGTYLWEVCLNSDPNADMVAAPLALPGMVVAEAGTMLQILDAKTGKQLFKFQDTNTNSTFWAPATIENGVLYQGNNDRMLYAFGM